MTQHKTITAAILVIGDEILSGRTKDQNIGYIAEYMTRIGVELREVRVVPDVEEEIVAALNALRRKTTQVLVVTGAFTRGVDIKNLDLVVLADLPVRGAGAVKLPDAST